MLISFLVSCCAVNEDEIHNQTGDTRHRVIYDDIIDWQSLCESEDVAESSEWRTFFHHQNELGWTNVIKSSKEWEGEKKIHSLMTCCCCSLWELLTTEKTSLTVNLCQTVKQICPFCCLLHINLTWLNRCNKLSFFCLGQCTQSTFLSLVIVFSVNFSVESIFPQYVWLCPTFKKILAYQRYYLSPYSCVLATTGLKDL